MNRMIELALAGVVIGVVGLCVHAVASLAAALPPRRRAAWLAAALAVLALGAVVGLWAPQQVDLGAGGSAFGLIALFLLWCGGALLGAAGAIGTLGAALGFLLRRPRRAKRQS